MEKREIERERQEERGEKRQSEGERACGLSSARIYVLICLAANC